MRIVLGSLVCLGLLTASAAGQFLGFDDFTWSLEAPAGYSATLSSELMHVESPTGGFCSESYAAYTTTALFDGTVRAHVDWNMFDICHYDWPVYLVNGMVTKYSVDGDTSCFLSGEIELEFDVEAGDSFGLGVGSADCWKGPGVADYTQFSFRPPRWIDVGGSLDPRLELAIEAPDGTTGFGSFLTVVGDVDVDGFPDLGVRAPFSAGPDAVLLVSGADGSTIWTAFGPPSALYGTSLAAPGDVDGDTVPDLAVGTYASSNVEMLSGADGSTIWSWTWSGSVLDYYARGLAAFGDRDGDGVTDIAVGASQPSSLDVRVLSGFDGAEIALIPPVPGDESFGYTLGAPGDLDGDGVGELIVSTRNTPLQIRVLSGATSTELYELEPSVTANQAFFSFARAGNVDGDTVPDLAVGIPLAWKPGVGIFGAVALFSGATGDEISVFMGPHPHSRYGSSVLGSLDADGDGTRDLAIGIPDGALPWEQAGGMVDIVRTSDGSLLQRLVGAPGDSLGSTLARVSTGSFAVGAPGQADGGGVMRYSDLDHPAGAPQLSFHGKLEPATPFVVTIDDGLPFGSAVLIVGLSQLDAPFKGGVLVPSADAIVSLVLDGNGGLALGGLWPPGSQLLPTLFVQAWLPDPSGPVGWSATSGLMSPAR